MNRFALVAIATVSLSATACTQHRYYAPAPPPSVVAQHEVRAYDDGYRQGYRAGWEHRGGSGAPGWLSDRVPPGLRHEFRRGYHDGFDRGKWESRHGYRPRY